VTALVYPTRDELLIRRNRGLSTADRIRAGYVIETNGCWRWIKGRTTQGYGHLSILSVQYQAHLLAYILYVGPIPPRLQADHLCRNRWCVNPVDIEFVTPAVNCQRGKQAILSPEQVDELRIAVRKGGSQRKLAPLYGVNHSTISRLVRGLTWAERPFPVEVAA
jgi:hypothetical protein